MNEDDDFEVVSAVVVAGVAASVTVVNVAAIVFNNIKYNFNIMTIISLLFIRIKLYIHS